jgi:ABC-2 type transport system ATP-binding protein
MDQMNTLDTMGATEEEILLQVNIREAGYEKQAPHLEDIQLQLKKGKLTGLIGPNGAGKSTTVKAILDLLPYCDADISYSSPNFKYAYLPEQPVYYDTLTLWEHLSLIGSLYGLEEAVFEQEANALLHKFEMEGVRDHLPDSFSKGMRQKMMLMLGFLIQPDVYIVDEPFIGLDPRATKKFLEMLAEEQKRGAGVLMSTHVLDTAEKICDDFILISSGKVVAAGELDQIRYAAGLTEGSLMDCFDRLT